MYVYVIAGSDEGPCKIGVSSLPRNRLSAIQTGSPHLLKLYHVEPVGLAAPIVERAMHLALSNRGCEAQNEWFRVSPREARHILGAVLAASSVVTTDEVSLQDLSLRQALQWVGYEDESEDEDRDSDFLENLDDVLLPSPLDQFALAVQPDGRDQIGFSDYLLTCEDGMWLRWFFERNRHLRRPSGTHFGPYFLAGEALEREHGRRIYAAARWIEWNKSRRLEPNEVDALVEIWNTFAPAHNKVFQDGPQRDTGGVDDHVDDVHPFVLFRDKDRGDSDALIFDHAKFRAVLIAKSQQPLVSFKRSIFGELCSARRMRFEGFLAPPFGEDLWTGEFRQWYGSAKRTCETAFRRFLQNPDKRYPAPRPYDGPQPGTSVTAQLPSRS